MRLSPSLPDAGQHGFLPRFIGVAREKGVSSYIGEGVNRWAGVHRLDAARLYRLALEKGEAGWRYHGIGDEGISTREIAETIGRRLNLPVRSLSAEEAKNLFGWMSHFFSMTLAGAYALTRERLGWERTHPGLLADLHEGHYFAS